MTRGDILLRLSLTATSSRWQTSILLIFQFCLTGPPTGTAANRDAHDKAASDALTRTDRAQPLLRGVDPHTGQFRARGETAGRQCHQLSRIEHSSAKKGESLSDTARTLAAMRPDIHGGPPLRDRRAEIPRRPDRSLRSINAGDGMHEHPTQALLDAFTLTQRWGSVGGRRVLIVGDILHSRVARSNIGLLNILGAEIRLCAPPTLLPNDADQWGVEVFHDLDRALEGCDAVMALRQQKERMSGGFVPSGREFFHLFGLTHERIKACSPDVLVMHPGPMNRGVEIHTHLADDPDMSVILDQVENGVAIRMAALELIGGNLRAEAEA